MKAYFKTAESCPVAVSRFFRDSTSIFWLHFIDSQLQLSNESILKVESSKSSAFEIAAEIRLLNGKVSNRKNLMFIPPKAKVELMEPKMSHEKQVEVKKFVVQFYLALHKYLELWSKSLDGTEVFDWMNLNEAPAWSKVEASLEYVTLKGVDKIDGEFLRFHE